MKRDFLRFNDLSIEEILPILVRGREMKSGDGSDALAGKSAVLMFEKPSLRTKLSFWIGVERLGGKPVYFNPEEVGLDKREPAGGRSPNRVPDGRSGRAAHVCAEHPGPLRIRLERAGRECAHRRRTPVPGVGRPTHDTRKPRVSRRGESGVHRRRQQRRREPGARSGRHWWATNLGVPGGVRASRRNGRCGG